MEAYDLEAPLVFGGTVIAENDLHAARHQFDDIEHVFRALVELIAALATFWPPLHRW